MLDRLQKLQDKCRALTKNGRSAVEEIKNDPALKKEIEEVYLYYFGRRVTGCSNCLWDALLELTFTLKQATAKMKTDKYILKRGKILHDVINQDASLDATRDNMTEDLALYHLYTNPHAKQFFETLPEGVEKLVKKYGEKYEAAKLEKDDGESTDNTDPNKVLAERETALAALEAKVLELATAVIELDDLINSGGELEAKDAKREEIMTLVRELSETPEPGKTIESDAEVELVDGTKIVIREGVGYNDDGTIAKRGTFDTVGGGKLIVGNKGKARTEAVDTVSGDGAE